MENKMQFLSSNLIKILACLFMTIDHIGLVIFPDIEILRSIGRIAMPLFAYLVAEGAYYTKNRLKYLTTMADIGIAIQIVYTIATKDYHMNIMLTFAFSLGIIFLVDLLLKGIQIRNNKSIIVYSILSLVSIVLVIILFAFVHFDYTYFGLLIPVILYFTRSKYYSEKLKFLDNQYLRILLLLIILVVRSFVISPNEMYSIIACLILLFYNNKRGKYHLKYLFYFYYPFHLLVIYLISLFLK